MAETTVDGTNNDFIKVSSRKRNKKVLFNLLQHGTNNFDCDPCHIDKSVALRRIQSAKQDLVTSDFHSSFFSTLREALHLLGNPDIKEIICYGLGHLGDCMISRYQLALLLCLKDLYTSKIFAYDPIFYKQECNILEELNINVINENEEGKRKIQNGETTLFYLPHCPKQLTNNILWTNWGTDLKDCIIIGNSFVNIIENNPKKLLCEEAELILNISAHVEELSIVNSFKYFDIFNDLSVHVFPEEKLRLLAPDFWIYSKEPKYDTECTEIILNKLKKLTLEL